MSSTRIVSSTTCRMTQPDGNPLPWLTRYRLADYDHLVLVADRSSGRYLGFLAASDGATTREDFLLLETAFVTTVARGQNLMRRMIALAMLRIGGMGPVPSVIVASTRNPHCYRIMRDIARRFTNAVFFPNPDSVTINFHTATLAQRIAVRSAPTIASGKHRDDRRGDASAISGGFHRQLSLIRRSTACWPATATCQADAGHARPPPWRRSDHSRRCATTLSISAGAVVQEAMRAPRRVTGTGDEPNRDQRSSRSAV